jgi:asparagine N-glycosylation enzyme membrane subunit Stt3
MRPVVGVLLHIPVILVERRFKQKYGGDAAGHLLHIADFILS